MAFILPEYDHKINPLKNKIVRYTAAGLITILSAVALLATILPAFRFKEWYFRIFDYPRLQTFFMAISALAIYLLVFSKNRKRDYFFIGILLIIIFIQAYKAYPYTPLAKKQVLAATQNHSNDASVSLFICNVLMNNTEYEKVLKTIHDYNPDIIITTESDIKWQKKLSTLDEEYPFLVPVPLDNTYGMHLYSKLPLQNISVRYLVEPGIPSIRVMVKLRSSDWIHLFVVHPQPPIPGHDSDSRERDAEILLVGKEANREDGGVIVAGDFNDVAWSETSELFQEVSGFLDPRRGRGFYNTYHAKYPIFRWPLDHIFHSAHFRLIQLERLGNVGSDHFPMFVHLSYEPDKKWQQPDVMPDEDTREESRETIKEGKKAQ